MNGSPFLRLNETMKESQYEKVFENCPYYRSKHCRSRSYNGSQQEKTLS